MKFLVYLAIGGIVILLVSSTNVFSRVTGAPDPEQSISQVNDILERSAAGGPLQGEPADKAWVARVNAECARREQRLATLPRPTTLAGLGPLADRILAIHRAYARRVAALRPPAGTADDARKLRRLNIEQERALRRVARSARTGDYSRASREAVSLRELAGRANSVLLGLGLTQCPLRASGMPL